MKRTHVIAAASAVVLAVTGIFATKASFKFHPGTTYFYYASATNCTDVTCTDFNTQLGRCVSATTPIYSNSTCTQQVIAPLFVPNAQ